MFTFNLAHLNVDTRCIHHGFEERKARAKPAKMALRGESCEDWDMSEKERKRTRKNIGKMTSKTKT